LYWIGSLLFTADNLSHRVNAIFRNASVLSVAHIVGYVIPLLEIPILARALGPHAYANVVFFQSVALLSSLVVEYGFNLSASRQVALARNDQTSLSRIFSDVSLAKAILSVIVIATLVTLMFATSSQGIVSGQEMIFWSFIYFVAFGFSPFWYFQGRERMVGVVILELGLRSAGLFFLYFLVKSNLDAALALAIMSSVGVANTVLSTAWCFREIGVSAISLRGAITQIRQGFHIFLYRSSNNILLSAAPPVLAFSAGQSALAVFVPAEKVIRGVVGLVTPVLTAFFPHFSRGLAVSGRHYLHHGWAVVFSVALAGTLAALFLWFLGPTLLTLVLGAQYALAGKLLLWFVWLIPLRMTNQALGMALLIPARKDRVASGLLMAFSGLALGFGGALATQIGALGMVIGFIVAEGLLLVSLTTVAVNMAPDIFRNLLTKSRKNIGADQ